MHIRARLNQPERKNKSLGCGISPGIEGKWAQCVILVKPKLISEESRFIDSPCHNFDHKISLFSSSLKKYCAKVLFIF